MKTHVYIASPAGATDCIPVKARAPLAILVLALLAGAFLRLPPALFENAGALHVLAALHPNPKFKQTGFDEGLYRNYVNQLIAGGLSSYPEIVDAYRAKQETLTGSILPPTRFLYIFAGYAWHALFRSEALDALKNVASFFSIATLFLGALFAWRLRGGVMFAAPVAALTAFAPTQLHMSQHALVDGFFTFWALLTLWLLWENLRAPNEWRRLAVYAVALMFLVLTKENAFFVWIAIVALIVANRWLQFGKVTRELLLATVIGPLLGVIVLIFLAGGVSYLLATYQLSVSKNYTLQYAILTGDGPWHRYLADLLLVSPVVLLLAIGSMFRLKRDKTVEWFLVGFIAASYAVMCNVKYGMNLRYANMWDVPLRMLAVSTITTIAPNFRSYARTFIILAVALVGALELRQYIVLSVNYPLYELVSEALLRALHIIKSAAPH